MYICNYLTERHHTFYEICVKMLRAIVERRDISGRNMIRDVSFASKLNDGRYYDHCVLKIAGSRNIVMVQNQTSSDSEYDLKMCIQHNDGDFFHSPFNICTSEVLRDIVVLFGEEEHTLNLINPESSTVEEDLFQMSTVMHPEVLSTVLFCSLMYSTFKKHNFNYHMLGTYIFNTLSIERLKALNAAFDKVLV